MKITRLSLLIMLCCLSLQGTAQLLPWPIDTINGTPVYRYTVEKSIGLYRLSLNFQVTQSEILQWNPSLEKRGLRYDEVILIPVKQQAIVPEEVTSVASTEVTKTEEAPIVEESIAEKPAEPIEPIKPVGHVYVADTPTFVADTPIFMVDTPTFMVDSTTMRIVFLLPLHAQAIERDKSMDRFYDFYAGSLIALYEEQQLGRKIEVHTYDIERTELKMMSALHDSDLVHCDCIIGPAYASQVNLVSQWSKDNHVPVLIPFINTVPDLASNNMLWQFNPGIQMEADMLTDSLLHWNKPVHCILIESEEEHIPASVKALRNAIMTKGISHEMTSIHAILADSLQSVLRDDAENIFIFNTERFGNLQAVMPHLLSLRMQHDITLFSHYSWQKENISLPQLYTTVFAQPDAEQLAKYEQLFDLYFHHHLSTDLPRYDLLGYDLTHFAIRHLSDSTLSYRGLQSSIVFTQQQEQGGYMNTGIQIIRK